MKYKLTNETKIVNGTTLFRILNVITGQKGGFIRAEDNLSQSGDCWAYDDSVVMDDAVVSGNASIYGVVRDNAEVYDNGVVHGEVYEHAKVSGNAKVYGRLGGNRVASGDEVIYGDQR